MRVFSALTGLMLLSGAAAGQAPPSSDLWRIATASLTVPPALATGPTASFWNAAAARPAGRLAAGLLLIQTSDILGISGTLGALIHAVDGDIHVGVMAGRVDVGDLIRTTTSPNSEAGSVPVYAQFAGAVIAVGAGPLRMGGTVRLHDVRFDADRTSGTTVDLGMRLTLTDRLRVAAATQFFPTDFNVDRTTEYHAAAEYTVFRSLRIGSVGTQLAARYGATVRPGGEIEHAVGAGFTLDRHVRLDASVTRESGYGDHPWRPGIGLALELGRYRLTIARSSGVNDLGATYRMGLDVGILR